MTDVLFYWFVFNQTVVTYCSLFYYRTYGLPFMIFVAARSILPPCPIDGMWGSRKTSWDGQANKKPVVTFKCDDNLV